MKVVLLEASLIDFVVPIWKEIKMEGESGVTRNIIDELHFRDIEGDQMEAEGGGTRSIIEELHFWDIQVDQM